MGLVRQARIPPKQQSLQTDGSSMLSGCSQACLVCGEKSFLPAPPALPVECLNLLIGSNFCTNIAIHKILQNKNLISPIISLFILMDASIFH